MKHFAASQHLVLAFARTWDLRETMVFEDVYHENLRNSLEEKTELLEDAKAVWLYEARTRQLIGETYGVPIEKSFERDEEGFEDVEPFLHKKSLYIFSTTILPAFQGRGLSRILKAFSLGVASEGGFRTVLRHARSGKSVALNKGFGAKVSAAHPDWYGTNETYYFYTLMLSTRGD